jgi:hypothetical protein
VKKNFFKVANFRHYVTTLALSLRPKQWLARLQAEREA